MEQPKDQRTPRQIELFEKMADELTLDRQRDLLGLAATSVLTCNMEIEPWERELVDELRSDQFFRETVEATIPA